MVTAAVQAPDQRPVHGLEADGAQVVLVRYGRLWQDSQQVAQGLGRDAGGPDADRVRGLRCLRRPGVGGDDVLMRERSRKRIRQAGRAFGEGQDAGRAGVVERHPLEAWGDDRGNVAVRVEQDDRQQADDDRHPDVDAGAHTERRRRRSDDQDDGKEHGRGRDVEQRPLNKRLRRLPLVQASTRLRTVRLMSASGQRLQHVVASAGGQRLRHVSAMGGHE